MSSQIPTAPSRGPHTLFDTAQHRIVNVTDEALESDPSRFQPIADQKTYMVSPEGKKFYIPANNAQKAIDAGYSFFTDDEIKHKQKVDEYLKDYDSSYEVGKHSFLNQIGMGVQDVVEGHTKSPEELEAIEIAKQHHELSNWGAGAAGLVSNVALTHGLGTVLGGGAKAIQGASKVPELLDAAKAAEGAEDVAQIGKDIVKANQVANKVKGVTDGIKAASEATEVAAPGLTDRLVQQATEGAKMGAIYSSPQAVAKAAYGDYKDAAETIAIGAGFGGLLNVGVGSIGEVGKALQTPIRNKFIEEGLMDAEGKIDSAKISELAQRKIDEPLLKEMGISNSDANNLGPKRIGNIRKLVNDEGLTADTTRQQIDEIRQKIGASYGEHTEFLDKELSKVAKADNLEKVFDPVKIGAEIKDKILASRPGITTMPETFATEANELDKIVNDTVKMKPGGFAELQQYKNNFSDKNAGLLGKPSSMLNEKQKMLKDIYWIISDEQDAKMNAAYDGLDMKEKYAQFLADKEKYAAAKDLLRYGPKEFNNFGKSTIGGQEGILGKAVEYGMIGALYHHPGAMLIPIAKKIVAHFSVGGIKNLSTKALQEIADNTETVNWIGAALAKDSIDSITKTIMKFPNQLATRAVVSNSDVIKDILGDSSNGLSKKQQYQKLTDSIVHAQMSPEQINQETKLLVSVFHFDPNLQSEIAKHQKNKIDYLYKAMPKNPNPPKPFTKDNWEPPKSDKKAFLDKVEVAHNPMIVMDRIADGTLNNNHLEALDALYPQMKQKLVGAVQVLAHDPKAPFLPIGTRLYLSKLTGVDLMNLDGINYQSAYSGTQAMPPEAKQPKSHQVKQTKFQKMPSFDTQVSRLDHKSNGG